MYDVETLKHFADLMNAYKDVGWQVFQILFIVIMVVSMIPLIMGMLQKMSVAQARVGKRYGFIQVNRSIKYQRKRSLARRMKQGDTQATFIDASVDDADTTAPVTDSAAVTKSDAMPTAAPVAVAVTDETAKLRTAAYASSKPVCWIAINNDMMASQRVFFSKCVDEVLQNKDKFSRVVIAASSPGGAAPMYGHMYYEMERLRNKSGLFIQVVSDWCAASGGYMQAAPAHEILAPDTAIIGSIGVIATVMNFRKALGKYGVDVYEETAGEYKRTLSSMGEINQDKIDQFRKGLKKVHEQFIKMVVKYRTKIDPKVCCNGEHWLAEEALQLGLIDRIASSQEMLFEANQKNDIIFLVENVNPMEQGIFRFLTRLVDRAVVRALDSSPFGRFE